MNIKLRGFVRSRENLKTLDLNYHNVHGHKTWHGDDLLWVSSTHKATWSYNHVVLQDHVTN